MCVCLYIYIYIYLSNCQPRYVLLYASQSQSTPRAVLMWEFPCATSQHGRRKTQCVGHSFERLQQQGQLQCLPVCRGKRNQLFVTTSAVQFYLGRTPDIWIWPMSCQLSPYIIQGFNTQASLESKCPPPCFISATYYDYQEQVYKVPIILNQILKINTIRKKSPCNNENHQHC